MMLDMIKTNLDLTFGDLPTTSCLWKSIQNKYISKEIQHFLWMSIHDAYKVGDFWTHIPNEENKGFCYNCQVTESLTHTFSECDAIAYNTIWDLIRKLWEYAGYIWPERNIGIMLGSTAIKFKDANNLTIAGKSNLYMILMTETTFLQWKIRCKWRIVDESDPGKIPTLRELTQQWVKPLHRKNQL